MARFEMKVAYPSLVTLTAAFLGLAGASLFASQLPDRPDPLPKPARLRLGADRFHHGEILRRSVFTPDGKSLVTLDRSHLVRVWDLASGSIVRVISEPGSHIDDFALSPDARRLATTEALGPLRLWDLATGRQLRRWHGTRYAAYDLPVFSPNGRILAVGQYSIDPTTHRTVASVNLWDVDSATERRRLHNGDWNSISQLAFSPDANRLAVACIDVVKGDDSTCSVRLLDMTTLEERMKVAPGELSVRSVAFSPDGKLLAYSLSDETVRLRERTTGRERVLPSASEIQSDLERREVHAQGLGRNVRVMGCLTFSPDGRILACGSTELTNRPNPALAAIRLWDVARSKELFQIRAHSLAITSLSFSPDGATLASTGTDRTVRFWDVTTGHDALPDYGHRSAVRALVVSPDDRTVFTGGDDGTVRQWNLASGREMGVVATFARTADTLAIAPDGMTLLVGGSQGGTFVLWSIAEKCEIREFPRVTPKNPVRHIAFSPDGKTVASERRIWDVTTGRVMVSFRDRDESNDANANFFPVFYSSDGRQVITTENEGVRVWDIALGKQTRWAVRSRIHHDRTALSPDGRYLATGGVVGHFEGGGHDPRILIWDLASGREVAELVGHAESTNGLSFSPDGRLLASGGGAWESSNDATVRVWDLATSREIGRFTGHRGAVNAVAFTHDARTIVSGGNATALVWDVADLKDELAQKPPFDGDSLPAAWDALAGNDAKAAYRAGWALSNRSAVGFLLDHLQPASAPDPKGVPAASGPIAPPETLRTLRAIAALERVGTPEARTGIERMSHGNAGAIETREAASSLERLNRPRTFRASAGAR